MKQNTSLKGFTIIELLVVVGIMSLISSIMLVSIQSARDKADNSYTIQTIRQYLTALTLIKDKTGNFPMVTPLSGWTCLGRPPNGTYCMYNDIFPDPLITNAFGEFLPSLPSPNPKGIINQSIPPSYGGPTISGSLYTCATLGCIARIQYLLKGANQNCGFGAAAVPYGTGTYCDLSIPSS
jgi:prepilin-type N-terminal cleavage/methylation domain-containing protein